MSFWYLASPYSKYPFGIEAAFDAVVQARGLLIRANIPCFSPIIHSHPVAKACGLDPYNHSIWLSSEAPMLHAAKGLIVLKLVSWETSCGIHKEVEAFQAAGKTIIYMNPGFIPKQFLAEKELTQFGLSGAP
jgi:Domain of unknown function (DUF1937)